MTTFVLVPGLHHGGWWYAQVVDELARAGHRAVAVTLPGLDPDEEPSDQLIAPRRPRRRRTDGAAHGDR